MARSTPLKSTTLTSGSLILAALLLIPLQAAMAQTSGGAGAPGANPSAGARPNPGVLGESINNSNPNPSLNPGATGNAPLPNAPLPNAPGTNSAGTALPSGPSANTGAGVTTGSAGSRSGGRVGGVKAQAPNRPGDAEIRAADRQLDKKLKSICRGC